MLRRQFFGVGAAGVAGFFLPQKSEAVTIEDEELSHGDTVHVTLLAPRRFDYIGPVVAAGRFPPDGGCCIAIYYPGPQDIKWLRRVDGQWLHGNDKCEVKLVTKAEADARPVDVQHTGH